MNGGATSGGAGALRRVRVGPARGGGDTPPVGDPPLWPHGRFPECVQHSSRQGRHCERPRGSRVRPCKAPGREHLTISDEGNTSSPERLKPRDPETPKALVLKSRGAGGGP